MGHRYSLASEKGRKKKKLNNISQWESNILEIEFKLNKDRYILATLKPVDVYEMEKWYPKMTLKMLELSRVFAIIL